MSAANARGSLLGPSRMSIGGDPVPMKTLSRASIAGPSAGGGGALFAGTTRRSSVGVAPPRKSSVRGSTMGGGTRIVDTRNIGDKQFMNQSIRLLINYLTDHNFDHAISPKILTRPSSKDFINIITFLFKQIDSNFVCVGKFEDEVVAMFKQLGYPCQILKSNISAAGTPHAWPSLLAALSWLVDLLSYDDIAAIGSAPAEQEIDLDDPTATEKAFYSYMAAAYSLFLSGEDDRYTELERQYVSGYESDNAQLTREISSLEQRNADLEAQIKEVENHRAHLPQLETKKKDYQADLLKFQQLIEQLQQHRNQKEVSVNSRQRDLEKLTASLALIEDEVATLTNKVACQELSPEDVKHMIKNREQLELAQQQASENRQALQRRVWDMEMGLRDGVQALEDSARSYNSAAEDLKLVPQSARNSRGKNLSIDVDKRAKKREDLLRTNIREDVFPVLQSIKAELAETTSSLREQILAEEDASEEIDLKSSELESEKEIFSTKLKRAEDTYQREKDTLSLSMEQQRAEMAAVEERLIRTRDTAIDEARIAAAHRRLTDAKASKEMRCAEHVRKKREMVEAIMEAISQCASHRENVQEKLRMIRDLYSERLQGHLASKAATSSVSDAHKSETVYGKHNSVDSVDERFMNYDGDGPSDLTDDYTAVVAAVASMQNAPSAGASAPSRPPPPPQFAHSEGDLGFGRGGFPSSSAWRPFAAGSPTGMASTVSSNSSIVVPPPAPHNNHHHFPSYSTSLGAGTAGHRPLAALLDGYSIGRGGAGGEDASVLDI